MKKLLLGTLSFLTMLTITACGKKSKNSVTTSKATISEKNNSNEDNPEDIGDVLAVKDAKNLIDDIAVKTGEVAKNVGSTNLVFSVDGDLTGRNLSANVGTTRFTIGNASAKFDVDADLNMDLDRTNKIAKITYDTIGNVDCNISPKGNVVSLFNLEYNGSAYGDLYIQEKNDRSYFYTTFDISSDPNTNRPLIGGYQKARSDEYLAFTGITNYFDNLYSTSTVFDFSFIEDWENKFYKKGNTITVLCDDVDNMFDFGSDFDDTQTLLDFFGYGIKVDKIVIETNDNNEIIKLDFDASIDGTLNLALIDVTSNKIYNILKDYDEDLADTFKELDEYDLAGTVDFDLSLTSSLTVGYESKALSIPSKYSNAEEYEASDFIDDWFELPYTNRAAAISYPSQLACNMRETLIEYYCSIGSTNSWVQRWASLITKDGNTYSLTLNNYIIGETSEYYTPENPFDSSTGDGGMTVTITEVTDPDNGYKRTDFGITVSGTVKGYTIAPRMYEYGEIAWSWWRMFYIVD